MQRKNTRLMFISLFIVCIFFLSGFYVETSDMLVHKEDFGVEQIGSDQSGMEVFQQHLADGQLQTTARSADVVQIQQSILKNTERFSNLLSTFTYLAILFLVNGVLFLEGKGRLFVYFLTNVFLKARFLCELFIRKKKDGKKWVLAF